MAAYCVFCSTDWHDVKKIKIGLPASHDPDSYEFIQWKVTLSSPVKFSLLFYFFDMNTPFKYQNSCLLTTYL